MTEKCTNHYIAVVVDDIVYSCPRVMGTISSGNTQISGDYTQEMAKGLASVMQNGRLALPVKIVEMTVKN